MVHDASPVALQAPAGAWSEAADMAFPLHKHVELFTSFCPSTNAGCAFALAPKFPPGARRRAGQRDCRGEGSCCPDRIWGRL
eukprot:793024-Pyramimonas_sp.AAC.1